jgi:hypothetical protein
VQCNRIKPGVIAVPGIDHSRSEPTTVGTEGHPLVMDPIIQVDDADFVVPTIGIAKLVVIDQECNNETSEKAIMMESRIHNPKTKLFWTIWMLTLSFLLSISIVLGVVCWSGHCKRSPDILHNDQAAINSMKDPPIFVQAARAFTTKEELIKEVVKVLDGTKTTIYGRIEDWDVSLMISHPCFQVIKIFVPSHSRKI